jgi:transposase
MRCFAGASKAVRLGISSGCSAACTNTCKTEQRRARARARARVNTCANLLKIEAALWHFLRNPAVAPTNNAAERALRGFVIKRKLSFFTRSGRGLRFLERIFSTVQTCALQGRPTFGFLQEAIESWLAGKAAASLVPDHVLARQPRA